MLDNDGSDFYPQVSCKQRPVYHVHLNALPACIKQCFFDKLLMGITPDIRTTYLYIILKKVILTRQYKTKYRNCSKQYSSTQMWFWQPFKKLAKLLKETFTSCSIMVKYQFYQCETCEEFPLQRNSKGEINPNIEQILIAFSLEISKSNMKTIPQN